MSKTTNIISSLILTIRGQRVMLDSDLAALYGVETMRLNEQCKRNIGRFPIDFRFQLTKQEVANLISQNAISSLHGGTRKLPYVFTEHGAIMVTNVLKSKSAVNTSVNIVRAFVQMRQAITDYEKLEKKISQLEEKYDENFSVIFQTFREMIAPKSEPKRKIGFIIDAKKK